MHKDREALPQIGVPSYYWGSNCIHSSMFANCTSHGRCSTSFPSGPNQAATFDRSILRQLATVVGLETRAGFNLGNFTDDGLNGMGLDCWGPVINMNRDPRWGRNAEGGTEDPFLMGQLAEAWTNGLQKGDGREPRFTQVAVTLKHFDANSLDGGAKGERGLTRNTVSANISKYMLADYYWPAFKAGIRNADAKGVMCSYNAVNGVPTCADPLMRAAREAFLSPFPYHTQPGLNNTNWQAWNFTGYVTSDSDAVGDIWASHHYKPTAAAASCAAVAEGGCDIDSGNTFNDGLMDGVKQGLCPMAAVDQRLANTFRIRMELGLFDPIEDQPLWKLGEADIGTPDAKALNLAIAQSSLVLLSNPPHPSPNSVGNILPLKAGSRIAVVGPHASSRDDLIQVDTDKPNPKPKPNPTGKVDTGKVCPDNSTGRDFGFACVQSPLEAITALNGPHGSVVHQQGCSLIDNSTAGFAAALLAAKQADVVVMGLGITQRPSLWIPEDPGDHKLPMDYPNSFIEREAHDRWSIDLPEVQKEFARRVIALGKPTVVFLLNGGMVAVDELVNQSNVALVEAFYPGMEGAQALAESLFGQANKWGKMPYTIYPASWASRNSMLEHDLVSSHRTYRYGAEAVVPFGAGISLTRFTLSAATPTPMFQAVTGSHQVMEAEITVQNVGELPGDEVVMAYLHPKNVSLLTYPVKTLFDFQRLNHLVPGESRNATFRFEAGSFLLPDQDGNLLSVPGDYWLSFENGAGQVVQTGLKINGEATVVEPFPSPKRPESAIKL